ncbi:hypothetical protein C8R45DRAFT_1151677 [Mycena sanguinolenta]|nr:hypothetical protein C8R45DRAFT_1151677 [Mycena sanguinolenta]
MDNSTQLILSQRIGMQITHRQSCQNRKVHFKLRSHVRWQDRWLINDRPRFFSLPLPSSLISHPPTTPAEPPTATALVPALLCSTQPAVTNRILQFRELVVAPLACLKTDDLHSHSSYLASHKYQVQVDRDSRPTLTNIDHVFGWAPKAGLRLEQADCTITLSGPPSRKPGLASNSKLSNCGVVVLSSLSSKYAVTIISAVKPLQGSNLFKLLSRLNFLQVLASSNSVQPTTPPNLLPLAAVRKVVVANCGIFNTVVRVRAVPT